MPKAVASTSFASTSYALESSEENFCSSSNEEELTLDWLTHSLKDFAIFIAKNKEFLRTSSQEVKALDNKSTIEKVTEVSKRVHKHLNKCISGLTLHKEEFKREYSEWCNKYIDKLSDEENEENPNIASPTKKEKVKGENRVKESKDDRKKDRDEEEGEDWRNKAGSSGVKRSKNKGREDEEGEELRTEAKSSGKKSSKNKSSDDENQEDSRTESKSSGEKSNKNKAKKDDEPEKSNTEDKSSGKESRKKKKSHKKDDNENSVDEPKEKEILQSPLSPAESTHEIEPEGGQVVLESDDGDPGDCYFDTNTLLMETPHSNDEAEEPSFVNESTKDKAKSSNVVAESSSTSDIFATSIEVDENDEAPGLQEETSAEANVAKKKSSDQDLDSKSKKGKSLVPKKFSGKRPGPASKTGAMALPVMPGDTNSNGKKPKATSVADSQATQFTDEDDEIQLREKQALKELLASSEESDDSELFKKPIQSKKAKKSKRKTAELFVPSNADEFAHIAQLYQTCVVELTRCDKTGKLKKRGKKSRRDTDADIDK
jgi:hypothetical protein